jgi:hypothetical protein
MLRVHPSPLSALPSRCIDQTTQIVSISRRKVGVYQSDIYLPAIGKLSGRAISTASSSHVSTWPSSCETPDGNVVMGSKGRAAPLLKLGQVVSAATKLKHAWLDSASIA